MISARCPTFCNAINKNSLDNVFESSYVYFKSETIPFFRIGRGGMAWGLGGGDGVCPFFSSPGLYNREGKNVCANIFRRSWLAFIRCTPATLDMNFRAASLCTCIPTIGRPYSPQVRAQWCSLLPRLFVLSGILCYYPEYPDSEILLDIRDTFVTNRSQRYN